VRGRHLGVGDAEPGRPGRDVSVQAASGAANRRAGAAGLNLHPVADRAAARGAPWTRKASGPAGGAGRALGGSETALLVSQDGGSSFAPLPSPLQASTALAVDPVAGVLYVVSVLFGRVGGLVWRAFPGQHLEA